MLRIDEATRIARAHLDQYSDVPISTFAKPRQYVADKGYRIFEACYGCTETTKVYVLLSLRVHNDSTVTVEEDRRAVVRKQLMDKNVVLPKRLHALESVSAHFERAVHEPGATYPDWFVRVRMESGDTFDAVATIRKSNDDPVDVPVVVFRKRSDKSKFFKSFGENPPKRLAIIIPYEMTAKAIRGYLVTALNKIRKTHNARVQTH